MEQIVINISQCTKQRYEQLGIKHKLIDYQILKNKYQNHLSQQQIQNLKNIYQHGIISKNYHNQIIIFDKIGSIKLNQITKFINEQSLIYYYVQRLLEISQKILQPKQKIIWIIDLSGKTMQLASKKIYGILQKIIKLLLEYFPQILNQLIFINTPILFDTAWNHLSQFIPEKTQAKVLFLSDQSQLIQYIDKAALPGFLGGTMFDQKLNEKKYEKKIELSKQQEQQEQQNNLLSLKAALKGLSIGQGKHLPSAAQTPLNTEADQ